MIIAHRRVAKGAEIGIFFFFSAERAEKKK
jgi:hypothetical protein